MQELQQKNRRAALASLLEKQHLARRQQETIQDFERRKSDLQGATHFSKVITSRAREILREYDENLEVNVDHAYDENFPDTGVPAEPEADAEDGIYELNAEGTATIAKAHDAGGDDDESEAELEDESLVSYPLAVQSMMEILLEFKLGSSRIRDRVVCPLCVADDTMDHEKKIRRWEINHLQSHMRGKEHSPLTQFQRQAHRRAHEDARGRYVIPYTTKIFNKPPSLTSIDLLVLIANNARKESTFYKNTSPSRT